MKGGTVQIHWHGFDPILSVDFHLLTGLLATAGADRDIKLWALHREEKSKSLPSVTFKANLSCHSAAVNVIRFSPAGDLLASGGDGGELLIWKMVNNPDDATPAWKVFKTLGRHQKDVLDLEWSPDGAFLISGSVDNTCIIWDPIKGAIEQVLSDHQHYVQGVSWDPAGQYLASLSGDRTCRIYSRRPPGKKIRAKEKKVGGPFACVHVLCKRDSFFAPKLEEVLQEHQSITPPSKDANVGRVGEDALSKLVAGSPAVKAPSIKQYLFYDENMRSFFRRLSWSPDGSFLLVPGGVEKQSADAAPCSMSYIISRRNLSRPTLQLPAGSKPVVAVRFCPLLFMHSSKTTRKHDTSVQDIEAFELPFRLVFAVATVNSIFIYDTQQSCPIAIFGGLHYAAITDLAWSHDAKYLAVSSQDGFCTLVGFDEGELGLPMPKQDLPTHIAALLPASGLSKIATTANELSNGKEERSLLTAQKSLSESLPGTEQESFIPVLPQGPETPLPCHGPIPDSCDEISSNESDIGSLKVSSDLLSKVVEPCQVNRMTTALVQGPSTPLVQDGQHCKPPDENSEIYVRPLKFRRITPKAITKDQEPSTTSKPIVYNVPVISSGP